MAFREGERNVGIRLLADITEASPDAYLLMLKEANDERRDRLDSRDDRSGDDDPSLPEGATRMLTKTSRCSTYNRKLYLSIQRS